MNKKETMEIRRQFTPANCAITRICGCYVDHEKKKKMELREAFLSLPEEDTLKYFEIFKKTLSGVIGRNLYPLEFAADGVMPGGGQEFLLKLRYSRLEDDGLLEEFYDRVIEHYEYGENYYIILIHATYDIPGRTTDHQVLADASDEVYECILCSICPVSLSKPGLCYNARDNRIQGRIRDWLVEVPDKGFLFPAFTDRNADIHSLLYYTKKTEDLQENFVEQVLGTRLPTGADTQKEQFHALVASTLREEADYDTVRDIHDTLQEVMEENAENPEPLLLGEAEIQKIFESSGVDAKHMEIFPRCFEETVGIENRFAAVNVAETKKFVIKTQDIVLQVNPKRTDLVNTRMIDGRQCLVIAVDGTIEVNGIQVKTLSGGGPSLQDE